MYILIIHPSLGGHLGCLHFLAIVNRKAMRMAEQTLYGVDWTCQPAAKTQG